VIAKCPQAAHLAHEASARPCSSTSPSPPRASPGRSRSRTSETRSGPAASTRRLSSSISTPPTSPSATATATSCGGPSRAPIAAPSPPGPRARPPGPCPEGWRRSTDQGPSAPERGKARERIATPAEAELLLDALDPRDQAAFGLAVYAGLRMGEILALEWSDLDPGAGTVRVRRAWDHVAGVHVEPKSRAGTRAVRLASRLLALLLDYRIS
jgi:hypothetical protein